MVRPGRDGGTPLRDVPDPGVVFRVFGGSPGRRSPKSRGGPSGRGVMGTLSSGWTTTSVGVDSVSSTTRGRVTSIPTYSIVLGDQERRQGGSVKVNRPNDVPYLRQPKCVTGHVPTSSLSPFGPRRDPGPYRTRALHPVLPPIDPPFTPLPHSTPVTGTSPSIWYETR